MDLFVGDMQSVLSTPKIKLAASLFSTGLGSGSPSLFGANQDTEAASGGVRWLDNSNVVFLFSNSRGIRQIVRVNIISGDTTFLTDHATHVATFDIGSNGLIVYNAQAAQSDNGQRDNQRLYQSGYVIPEEADYLSVYKGYVSGFSMVDRLWTTEWFIRDGVSKITKKILISGRTLDEDFRHRVSISPDGQFAVVNSGTTEIPDSWDEYTHPTLRDWIAEHRKLRPDKLSRGLHQLYLIDLRSGQSRLLWHAPALIYASRIAWSPSGKSVLLAPTFLPVEDRASGGLSGEAVAVVNVADGKYSVLPLSLPAFALDSLTTRWVSEDTVELRFSVPGAGPNVQRFSRRAGLWTRMGKIQSPNTLRVKFEIAENFNSPPKLVASLSGSQKKVLIRDFNPGLGSQIELSRAEAMTGAFDGGTWEGLLFYPPQFRRNQTYPLVIQSIYGPKQAEEFTLSGWREGAGLGPSPIASYPGQALAARGIFVLTLNISSAQNIGTSAEAETRLRAIEAAVSKLIESGRVDRTKIGLIGFSRNGYWVNYALTHSTIEFAAAVIADNFNPSYVPSVVASIASASAAANGAEPFGTGLGRWLEEAPGFNADRIRTPLRLIGQSAGRFDALLHWETFSRLRELNRPVEIYIMPDAEEHGSHTPQNPGQIVAVQQGVIDWFDFWLNDREDGNGNGDGSNYPRWRRMRDQLLAVRGQERRPLLKWRAQPIPAK